MRRRVEGVGPKGSAPSLYEGRLSRLHCGSEMGWVFGGGLVGLLMVVLIYLGDHHSFSGSTSLSNIAVVALGLQAGEFIRRRREGLSKELPPP